MAPSVRDMVVGYMAYRSNKSHRTYKKMLRPKPDNHVIGRVIMKLHPLPVPSLSTVTLPP
jgi:hypothetical protein